MRLMQEKRDRAYRRELMSLRLTLLVVLVIGIVGFVTMTGVVDVPAKTRFDIGFFGMVVAIALTGHALLVGYARERRD